MSVDYSRLPEHMQEGAKLYIENHIEPDGFMMAVLENNFSEAIARADDINAERLRDWAMWMYWDIPSRAWGSPAKVQAWLREPPK